MKGHRRSYRTATDAFATCFATTSCLYKGQGNGSLAYSLRRLITFLPGCCVYDGAIFLFSLWRGRQRKNSHFFAVLPQLLLRFWFSCAYTSTSHVGLYAAPIGGPWPFNIFALSRTFPPTVSFPKRRTFGSSLYPPQTVCVRFPSYTFQIVPPKRVLCRWPFVGLFG